ncbi:integrase core domain-containing protein [Streptomyces hygroscopicus]|uniref:integrase core domain-containing protein n=1 Tax=Streptomyces hygroscopicus TaxID=1912 RepID=UPI0036C947FF
MDSLRFPIRDRDNKYTDAIDAVFQAEDIEIIKTPERAPKANAHYERVIGTLRREAPDHMLILDQAHARHVLAEHQRHYDALRARAVRIHRSANAFDRGLCGGVGMAAMPLPAKTASNAAVNLLSRSRMRNWKHPALSSRSMSRLRAS